MIGIACDDRNGMIAFPFRLDGHWNGVDGGMRVRGFDVYC